MLPAYNSSHNGDYSDRRVASSPVQSPIAMPESMEPSIRPMRLKVLYTFDDQNKTNCLARWPQILNIRTAYLDESMQVGVIELKTCIQAIVTASPELVAKLGQDYTVYAYDYSEYETPLVGQGMLSWVLASASSTPTAPADQSNTVVTGRVCKNILGLFGNGLQETLEVKLRLVPVPTCLQSEYIESMRKYKDLSRIIPEGFDAQAWTEFIRANPNILSVAGQSGSNSPTTSAFGQPQLLQQQHGIEHVQRLMTEGYGRPSSRSQSASQQPQQQGHHRRDSFATTVLSGRETAEMPSPTLSTRSLATTQQATTQYSQHSRAGSRASNREGNLISRPPSTSNSTDIGYMSNEERPDEGPARKRAKVTKASHPGKIQFGKKVDSLRVTASTAASVRVFQPTAIRPGASLAQSLDGPPRVPTPVPQAGNQKPRGLRPAPPRSNLSEHLLTSDSGYKSLRSYSDQFPVDSDVTSPEANRAFSMTNSPEELASSPPVIRDVSMMPSSPVLPALPDNNSSFMDTSFDDIFGDDAFDDNGEEDRPLTREDAEIAARYDVRPELAAGMHAPSEAPTDQSLPPQARPSARQVAQEKAKALSVNNAHRAIGLKRSHTYSADQPSSDPPVPKLAPARSALSRSNSVGSKKTPTNGAWDKTKRKNAIQTKLAKSIEAGEMPPFCENCGAIETPIWRKTYARLHTGDHSGVEITDAPGGIVALQIVEAHEDGSTKLFKVFKKTRSGNEEEDLGFVDVLLCNPCGIWLSNRQHMRPPHLWDKRKKLSDGKPKPRRDRRKQNRNNAETDQSDALLPPSDSIAPESESHMAQFAFDGQAERFSLPTPNETQQTYDMPDEPEPQLPPLKKRPSLDATKRPGNTSKSDSAIDQSAAVALQRAIQSSPPGRFLGSKQSPIEVDQRSPNSARRALFRSPKSNGPLGVSIDQSKNTRNPPKTPNEILREAESPDDQADKENLPPNSPTPNDGLDDLFTDFSPVTPSRGGIRDALNPDLLKTPIARSSPRKDPLTPGDFFSSAAKAFLHRTPTRNPSKFPGTEMTPFTHHLNQLLSESGVINSSPGRLLNDLPLLNNGAGHDNGQANDDSLPNLNDGGTPSRMFRGTTADFDFSAFQDSDGPVPSSPPAWFGVYEDPPAGEQSWAMGFGSGSSPVKDVDAGLGAKEQQEKSVAVGEDIATAAATEIAA